MQKADPALALELAEMAPEEGQRTMTAIDRENAELRCELVEATELLEMMVQAREEAHAKEYIWLVPKQFPRALKGFLKAWQRVQKGVLKGSQLVFERLFLCIVLNIFLIVFLLHDFLKRSFP